MKYLYGHGSVETTPSIPLVADIFEPDDVDLEAIRKMETAAAAAEEADEASPAPSTSQHQQQQQQEEETPHGARSLPSSERAAPEAAPADL
jgi:hypothetical protein